VGSQHNNQSILDFNYDLSNNGVMTKKYKHSPWQDLGSVISGIIIAFFVVLIFSVFSPLVLLRVFPPEKAAEFLV
jgi:hypothetical protein